MKVLIACDKCKKEMVVKVNEWESTMGDAFCGTCKRFYSIDLRTKK